MLSPDPALQLLRLRVGAALRSATAALVAAVDGRTVGMGWFSSKKPVPIAKHTTKRISLSSVSHGHSPDKRKGNKGLLRSEGPPIDVKRTWGGYKVIDGNDRVYWARQAGRSTIRARVWD